MRQLVALAALCTPAAAAAVVDWTAGPTAWKTAREASLSAEPGLWSEANGCDPKALSQAAPLTVLFGLATFWNEVRAARDARGGSAGQPLEVHVLGAAYPFEGRSDWGLLAARRPPDVPKVRVVLVLGTPFQADGVPEMRAAEKPEGTHAASLLQVSSGRLVSGDTSARQRQRHLAAMRRHPIGGYWDEGEGRLMCSGKGAATSRSEGFDPRSVCRDHGNGLEVVCVEKFYQDVSGELPEPDLAVMFNPGFPQPGRRSWDAVLLDLLARNVTMLVSSQVYGDGPPSSLLEQGGGRPGGPWHVQTSEDFQTTATMAHYGASSKGVRQSPFPILEAEDNDVVAKNAVVQVIRGFREGRAPPKAPSATQAARDREFLEGVDWKRVSKRGKSDLGTVLSMKKSLLVPVSRAYDDATREVFLPILADQVAEMKLSDAQREKLRRLGVPLGPEGLLQEPRPARAQRWGPRALVWLMENVGVFF